MLPKMNYLFPLDAHMITIIFLELFFLQGWEWGAGSCLPVAVGFIYLFSQKMAKQQRW